MKSFLRTLWKYVYWSLAVLVALFVGLVIYRIPAVEKQKQSAQTVAFIQSRHLTLADADGSHLPPPPDQKLVDATVAGVDANQNGIRDDVELAIFAKYPNSPYTRAAELQYAMVLQMYLTQVFNSDTLIAVAQEEERASACLADTISRDDIQVYGQILRERENEVKNMLLNTKIRHEKANENTYLTKSFGSLEGSHCDVDAKLLSG